MPRGFHRKAAIRFSLAGLLFALILPRCDLFSPADFIKGYGVVVPSSLDLTIKFGMRSSASVPLTGQMVKSAFTSLHQLISSPRPGDDFMAIIRLGDYIDLPSLTINGTTINDAAITGGTGRGNLLRLIVVGKNSFNGINPGAPGHVVFQFQNVPVTREMEAADINTNGYAGSAMKTYLMGDFLAGLQAATGLTDAMLWAPTRKVSRGGSGGSGPDDITDTLWLPTEWEMFGAQTNSSQQYEVDAGQARLEYYVTDENRIKYDSNNYDQWYWLASPHFESSAAFCSVYEDGTIDYGTADTVGGCVPAFCVK